MNNRQMHELTCCYAKAGKTTKPVDRLRVELQVLSERDEWLTKAIAQTLTKDEQELLNKAIGPLTKLVDYE